LVELTNHPIPIPFSGIKEEFIGALQRIKQQQTNQTIKQLIEKAKNTELNKQEKQHLQTLLANKTEETEALASKTEDP